ncbi:hypothetical protein C8N24_0342 [Solirubrobacter pauli]|uniref:Uncharacterized protein n=1 Tax=Solirubrobacter pauli TaxID=166793 RepID=A0A660L6B1_9ACTN|nr:hypothetical protein [Solirubrobacter pauli]RKQ90537.1 hypothetical protein C8N24_0342 [Solirubrobacter pauli]
MTATSTRTHKPASDKQTKLLQELCDRLGETYTEPTSSFIAHREISRLIALDNERRAAKDTEPPTPRQLQHLRTLAMRTGQTFVTPTSKRQAAAEIDRLQGATPSTRVERYLDQKAVWDRDTNRAPNLAAIREDEVTGYGSTATWQ